MKLKGMFTTVAAAASQPGWLGLAIVIVGFGLWVGLQVWATSTGHPVANWLSIEIQVKATGDAQ